MSDDCSHLWEDITLQHDEAEYVLCQQCWKCGRERVLPVPERSLPAMPQTVRGGR